MRFIVAAGLAGVCLATSPLYAADLFGSAPPPMPEPAEQSELGANWYIRGEVGYGREKEPTINPAAGLIQPAQPSYYYDNTGTLQPTGSTYNLAPVGDASALAPVSRGNMQSTNGSDFGVGVGYRINDLLRIEGSYNFHYGPGYATQAEVKCPGSVTGVDNYYPTTSASGVVTYNPVPYGYVYPATACNAYLNSAQYNNLALATAYVDLGKWWLFQPYVGVGVGVNANTIYGSVNYVNTSTGTNYIGVSPGGDTSAPAIWVVQTGRDAAGHPVYSYLRDANGKGVPNITLGSQNWNRSFNSTKFTFAGQLAAGVGIPISQSATLDLGYRFRSLDVSNLSKNYMQTVTLGVRYNLN